MKPRQWSQAQDRWAISADVSSDGSVGIVCQDGRLGGHLRLRGREQAQALASLLVLAVEHLERGQGRTEVGSSVLPGS